VTPRARALGATALIALLAAALLASAPARAQLTVPARHEGALTLTLQAVTDHYHLNWRGDLVAAGHITAHSAQ
jgi:hypothetical protein